MSRESDLLFEVQILPRTEGSKEFDYEMVEADSYTFTPVGTSHVMLKMKREEVVVYQALIGQHQSCIVMRSDHAQSGTEWTKFVLEQTGSMPK